MAPFAMDLLRPKPFRGDVVAAGVVVLATLVWTVEVRFAGVWGPGAHLAYAAAAWGFVTTMAALAPMERDQPRAYQSVLYVAAVALFGAVLANLADVLGTDATNTTDGTAFWVFALLAVHAFAFAARRNSAVCTLLGAIAGGIAVLSFVAWAFDASRAATFRWLLLALFVVYGLAAVAQRDRRLRHGVALIDAAGFAMLAIAVSFLPEMVGFVAVGDERAGGGHGAGWGWELLVLAAGFGLIAYSSVDRQPGPAYLGVANLVAFVLVTSGGVTAAGATLLGWPVALALAALVLLVVGLRPTTPAPPPPDIDAPEPPPLPLRG